MKISRHVPALLLLAISLGVVGCSESEFDSHFVYSDRTLGLMREAQVGVGELEGAQALLDNRFGTPQALQAWSQLPIDFGGTFGTVAESPDASAAVKDFKVEFVDDQEGFEDEDFELQFITGDAAGTTTQAKAYDPESGIVVLSQQAPIPPTAGDQFIINGGMILKHARPLYMKHCSHCHGTSGDGAGPTAEYLTPRPRDYRHGVFKFTSTVAQAKVSRDDLHRVLTNGIPGTYMPSFYPMLKDDERHAVVEYVRFLAMRGEFERKVAVALGTDFSKEAVDSQLKGGAKKSEIIESLTAFLADDMPEELEFISDDLAESWTAADAEESLIVPSVPRVPDTPESRRIGRELYLSKTINCADCHGIFGAGNGPQTTIYEKNPVTQELYSEPGLHDVWDNVNQPRVLTQGIYRGGRRPIDLFRRIHAGIKGSRMPSFKNLAHDQIWHLVNYVLSIPFDGGVEPGKGTAPTTTASSTASL